ncbi:uncharacterized protein ASPGLDRAFT_64815 [Aspergillus glaucus CBS 516.65]|uniref:Zn(2)-C6 fungal-type domain-containing protein n=1 Tax=Aspergillus glaucus CBS 516.65 TaxID=1160497 RepID=A0A1L9VRJ3_ASPGL|nr:hypothetical protein ASPGLDRAFT_64815 [Aspergillus glaucus CBS 516.65]OJJ86555.1 hypothetical protein ASPGLDRAFT_64815 [Aspergillus glaucus CBS 516.65]
METDTNPRQHPQHRAKTRSRISAACVRCQKRKIRCDGRIPGCSTCQKARVNCVDGGASRDISRSYINDLESRVAWLESVVRGHAPGVSLDGEQNHQHTVNGARTVESPRSLEEAATAITTSRGYSKDDTSLRDVTDQIGLVSVNGADLRYLGPILGTPRGLPSDLRHAQWLSQTYFQSVHLQFPFLHEPTHMETVRKLHDGVDAGPACRFRIFMVLAISATIRSWQAKVLLSAEGYCASAVAHMDSLFGRPSLSGVQCILLLQVYTINNPSSGLSLWTLHYHCLASILELGLQHNVQGSHLPVFEQKMRTRVFWCVYTVDRVLSTLLGRQIGLMDEQCELRVRNTLINMSSAIHLFKLSKFNAEIKCVLYCVGQLYGLYTQPAITDIENWQANVIHRFRQWNTDSYVTGMLYYSWISTHLLFLCVIKMFYCVWVPNGVADEVDFDDLTRALKPASDVLSATG